MVTGTAALAAAMFTSLLLADMAEHGEVRLDEPVAQLLPVDFAVPSRNGRQITLLNLVWRSSRKTCYWMALGLADLSRVASTSSSEVPILFRLRRLGLRGWAAWYSLLTQEACVGV